MNPRPYRMEARKAASEATRARILEAARGLLRGPEGIGGFSMEAVAKAAGVSRMTVYHQFESKAGLFEALSDDLAARGQLGARMGEAMSRRDPLEALDGLLAAFAAFWDDDRVVMARLRAQTTIPIAAGSTATSDLVYLREYLLREAVDYLQPNVRDIGGYTQGLKAAGIAQAFNVPLAMGGNYPHLNMHLHAGVPNGGRVEFHWQGWKCVEALFDNARIYGDYRRVRLGSADRLPFNT